MTNDASSEDGIPFPPQDKVPSSRLHWRMRLMLTILLGVAMVGVLSWLTIILGFNFLLKALEAVGRQDVFWWLIGGETTALFAFGAAYFIKLHHSSAEIYAALANSWIGQWLRLGTDAGRWGILSRTIRTFTAVSYGVLIALFCFDVVTLGQLMVPYLVTMGVTWLGIAPGIVANNAKIEQMFEAELRLLDQIDQLLKTFAQKHSAEELADLEKRLIVGRNIPHGMFALWEEHRSDLFSALFLRKVHDVNSIIGSALSFTRLICAVVLPLFYALAITIPPSFFAIIIGSSILSSLMAWYTNWSRLQAHRHIITDLHQDYWTMQKALNEEAVTAAHDLAQKIIHRLLDHFPENTFITASIQFHLKKALLEYGDFIDDANREALIGTLVELLKTTLQPQDYRPTRLERVVNQDRLGVRHCLRTGYHFFSYQQTTTEATEGLRTKEHFSRHRQTTTDATEGLSVLEDQIAQRIIESKLSPQANSAAHDLPTFFAKNYEIIFSAVTREAQHIDTQHAHWIAFTLVTAYSRHHQNKPNTEIDASTEMDASIVTQLKNKGFFTRSDGRLDSKAIKNANQGISDPHGRTSLERATRSQVQTVFDDWVTTLAIQSSPAPGNI